ncbi:MAG: head-tail connector protein [Sporolactobacillus sp.]
MADDPTLQTELTTADVEEYLRVGPDDVPDEATIQGLMLAAEGYLLNAGCLLSTGDALAQLAEKMLVSHWYENREPVGIATKLAYGLNGIITQLQLMNPNNIIPDDQEGGDSLESGASSQ